MSVAALVRMVRRLLPLLLLSAACGAGADDPAPGDPMVAIDAGPGAADARSASTSDAAPVGACGPGEPANNSATTAQLLPGATTDGQSVCDDDADWFRLEPTTAGKLYVLGHRSILADGDLDADLLDRDGKLLGAAYVNPSLYQAENGVGPTDTEVYSVVGKPGAAPLWLRVYGWEGATNRYSVVSRTLDWNDGRCQDLFPREECRAQNAAQVLDAARLIVFPVTTADDPLIGRGTFTLSGLANGESWDPASRMSARRELIMILRGAIRAVQDAFPGTGPLGVGDISMPDGTTPEGHPNHTHDSGANVDFAYYIDPARQRAFGNMTYRQICCDASRLDDWGCVDLDTASAGYGTCRASATPIVDIPRTAMVIAKIAGSGRLRVIGVEARIKSALEAELGRLASSGKITPAERDLALDRMASKDDHPSWLWHFNHMHASFCAGDCPAPRLRAPGGRTQGPWPDEPLDLQADRAFEFFSRR